MMLHYCCEKVLFFILTLNLARKTSPKKWDPKTDLPLKTFFLSFLLFKGKSDDTRPKIPSTPLSSSLLTELETRISNRLAAIMHK